MPAPTRIRLAETDDEVASCFPVVHELRPHLDRDEFVRRVGVQRSEGYRLAYLAEAGAACAVAGFRVLHNLVAGRVLYVDDLVTSASRRSRGHGGELLQWLVEHARALGCDTLELDSGVQRFDAHRFYMLQRMHISSYHFRLALGGRPSGV